MVCYLLSRRIQGESVKELLVKTEGGGAGIESTIAYELKSIWSDDVDPVTYPEPR